jgi:S-adenosylmethionine decarboxylase
MIRLSVRCVFGEGVLSATPPMWQNLAHAKLWPEQDRSLRPEADAMNATALEEGAEWLVDAAGCDARQLSSVSHLQQVCAELVGALRLRVIGEPLWHQFPALDASGEAGGVTGLYLLAESHLACHTFPEHRRASFNLYCCRNRPAWDWEGFLVERLGAAEVVARAIPRGSLETVSLLREERRG